MDYQIDYILILVNVPVIFRYRSKVETNERIHSVPASLDIGPIFLNQTIIR